MPCWTINSTSAWNWRPEADRKRRLAPLQIRVVAVQFADFTLSELARLQRTLRRRFDIARDTNLIDVGFGVAVKGGRPDAARGMAATFLVRRKFRPRAAQRRLPDSASVRLLRGASFVTVHLRTDVVETAPPTPAGYRYHASDVGPATVGMVLNWRERCGRRTKSVCGLLTAGHAFADHTPRLVLVQPSSGGRSFNARLYVRSRRPSPVDAAILHVNPDDLLENEILAPGWVADGELAPGAGVDLPVAELPDVWSPQGTPATILRATGTMPFRVYTLLPRMSIRTLGQLEYIFSGWSPRQDAFPLGTSGAVWNLSDGPAALQIAGTPPEFRRGFGQAAGRLIDWAGSVLASKKCLVSGSLRIVAVF